LERPIGIYASSLSRRDLARRRARMRPPLLARTGTWVASGAFVALAALLGERLVG
jgi:prevent-host-death family protein